MVRFNILPGKQTDYIKICMLTMEPPGQGYTYCHFITTDPLWPMGIDPIQIVYYFNSNHDPKLFKYLYQLHTSTYTCML